MRTSKLQWILLLLTVMLTIAGYSKQSFLNELPEAPRPAPSREFAVEGEEEPEVEDAGTKYVSDTVSPDGRIYYAYRYEQLDWIEDETRLPAAWVAAAGEIVASNGEIEGEITFRQGLLYDFDGDGREEALINFYGLVDSIFTDSHTAYVGADGQAALLDTGSISRGPQAGILHYNGFRHLLLMTGAGNAAGSSHQVLRMEEGAFERLLSASWFIRPDTGVFLESGGPQGTGPAYFFWDEEVARYSAVAAEEQPVSAFTGRFSPNRLYDYEGKPVTLELLGLADDSFTEDSVEHLRVYGQRFYSVALSEVWCEGNGVEPDNRYMTWERLVDNAWQMIYRSPDGFGMTSLEWGGAEEFRKVTDVDMAYAEESAVLPDRSGE